MPGRAMEGACLARRVRMASPRCKAAQRICRRSGPGAPPTYADWQVATLRVVAVLARRESKSACTVSLSVWSSQGVDEVARPTDVSG